MGKKVTYWLMCVFVFAEKKKKNSLYNENVLKRKKQKSLYNGNVLEILMSPQLGSSNTGEVTLTKLWAQI